MNSIHTYCFLKIYLPWGGGQEGFSSASLITFVWLHYFTTSFLLFALEDFSLRNLQFMVLSCPFKENHNRIQLGFTAVTRDSNGDTQSCQTVSNSIETSIETSQTTPAS